jgi:hypothetical protein
MKQPTSWKRCTGTETQCATFAGEVLGPALSKGSRRSTHSLCSQSCLARGTNSGSQSGLGLKKIHFEGDADAEMSGQGAVDEGEAVGSLCSHEPSQEDAGIMLPEAEQGTAAILLLEAGEDKSRNDRMGIRLPAVGTKPRSSTQWVRVRSEVQAMADRYVHSFMPTSSSRK